MIRRACAAQVFRGDHTAKLLNVQVENGEEYKTSFGSPEVTSEVSFPLFLVAGGLGSFC